MENTFQLNGQCQTLEMVVLNELYLFILVSLTLILFQGYGGIKQLNFSVVFLSTLSSDQVQTLFICFTHEQGYHMLFVMLAFVQDSCLT